MNYLFRISLKHKINKSRTGYQIDLKFLQSNGIAYNRVPEEKKCGTKTIYSKASASHLEWETLAGSSIYLFKKGNKKRTGIFTGK